MAVLRTNLEEVEDRIIFMSVFNDIDWTNMGNYRKRWKCLRLVNQLDPWGKALLDDTSQQFITWMMALEERTDHAESTRYLVMTRIRNLRHMLSLINMELRCKYHPCWKNGSFSWIVISRDPNRHVDESLHDPEDPPQDIEKVSSTSVWAITSNNKKHRGNSYVEATGTF